MVRRSRPCFPAPDLYRDDGAANLFGSDVVRHFRKLPPAGNGLAVVYSGPHTFSRQVGNVSHRVLVGIAICGEVPKIRDACNEAAIILAIDHRPVPNSVHASLP